MQPRFGRCTLSKTAKGKQPRGSAADRRWVMGTRRQFSREFKLEAVRLVKERGVSVAQAARDLDVHENVLRKLIREQQAFPS